MLILFILPFTVALLQILLRMLQNPQYLNHDVALFLQCAQLILEGKLPYVDFVEINPPLIFYLSIIPVRLSQFLHETLPVSVYCCVFTLIVYSLLSSLVVLHKRVESADWMLLGPMLFAFLIFNIPLFYHFGQREHIFVITFMPFFLMRWLRYQGSSFGVFLPIIVGSVAAMGLLTKAPYFVILPLSLEAYWFISNRCKRTRLVDPEVLTVLICAIVYALLFFFGEPTQVVDSYLYRWVPLTEVGYCASFCSIGELFSFNADNMRGCLITGIPSLILVIVGSFFMLSRCSLIGPLLIWTIAGWSIYLLQRKGWGYHTIPMMAGYFMLANLELAIIARWVSQSGFRLATSLRRLWSASTLTFILYGFSLCMLLPVMIRDSFATGALSYVLDPIVQKYSHEGSSVLPIVPVPNAAYPTLILAHRRPASRYLWTYPLFWYGYLQSHSRNEGERKKYAQAQSKVVAELYEDALKSKPKLIAIWMTPPNWWNSSWTAFSALDANGFTRLLNDYDPVDCGNGRYSVWVRRKTSI